MKYAFIGFGEAGQAFVTNWAVGKKEATSGFDLKSLDAKNEIRHLFAAHSIKECQSADDAVRSADVIFSLVTADQAEVAARSAQALKKGALFLDCNSVSPGTKRGNAEIIMNAGGKYVDVAVMAPVHPALNKVPLMLSGAYAEEAEVHLLELGMNPTVLVGDVGYASSIKMIRSIMVKGMEALTAECALAAVQAGIDEPVFASLVKSFPGIEWEHQIAYNLERMAEHGPRRAAEMKESAKTIAELGLPNSVTQGTVDWQERIGALGHKVEELDYKKIAVELLPKLLKD